MILSAPYVSSDEKARTRFLIALLFSEPPKSELFYEPNKSPRYKRLFRYAASGGHLSVTSTLTTEPQLESTPVPFIGFHALKAQLVPRLVNTRP